MLYSHRPVFTFKLNSLFIFIAAAIAAWVLNIAAQIIFPAHNLFPFVARTIIMLATDVAIVYTSFRLLESNGLPRTALGLSVSRKTFVE